MDSRLSKEGLCNEKVIALWAPNRQTKMVVNLDPVGIAATWNQQDTEKGNLLLIVSMVLLAVLLVSMADTSSAWLMLGMSDTILQSSQLVYPL